MRGRKISFELTAVAILLAAAFSSPPLRAEESKPNIVILLADDLGWADVGFHGSPIATPNIDSIAREGTVLDRFYVCPVCTPTRAGLMTGRYPIRFGLMRAVLPPWRKFALAQDEVLMPEILAKAGYEHRGMFGKWHLGHGHIRDTPTRRGFTEFLGHYNGNIDYFTHQREGELDWHRNEEPDHSEGYSTDLIAAAAARFITEHAGDGPFLCYVPFNAPHSPFQAKDEDIESYRDLPELPGARAGKEKKRPVYAAMVTSMDEGIGRILQAIDEAGIAANTLVWFMSDNGGTGDAGDNRPLRGKKGQVFEGGIRVPAAVRWPGRVEPGETINSPLAYIDVLPTLMNIVGLSESGGKPLDGIDMLDVLTRKQSRIDRDLFDYTGQKGEDREEICLITPKWKLVVRGPNIINQDLDDSKRETLLFHIDWDRDEKTNLAAEHPERVEEMYRRLLEFLALQPAR
ncbi:MAG: sulfatase-like hydrolase/transferase, partial [Verrucomicrobiales bacterium]